MRPRSPVRKKPVGVEPGARRLLVVAAEQSRARGRAPRPSTPGAQARPSASTMRSSTPGSGRPSCVARTSGGSLPVERGDVAGRLGHAVAGDHARRARVEMRLRTTRRGRRPCARAPAARDRSPGGRGSDRSAAGAGGAPSAGGGAARRGRPRRVKRLEQDAARSRPPASAGRG